MTNMVGRGGKAIAAWQRVATRQSQLKLKYITLRNHFVLRSIGLYIDGFHVALLLTCVYFVYVFFCMQDLFVWFINDSLV